MTDLYTFPKRGELRHQLQLIWPSASYDNLIENIAGLAGKTVTLQGLVASLSFAIEDFVAQTERCTEFRAAAYANMPAVIHSLVADSKLQRSVLSCYRGMLLRLHQQE